MLKLETLDIDRVFSDVRIVVDGYQRLFPLPAAQVGPQKGCSGTGTTLREIIELQSELGNHRP